MSRLEDALVQQLRIAGLPEPVREYRFCERRWRLDQSGRTGDYG